MILKCISPNSADRNVYFSPKRQKCTCKTHMSTNTFDKKKDYFKKLLSSKILLRSFLYRLNDFPNNVKFILKWLRVRFFCHSKAVSRYNPGSILRYLVYLYGVEIWPCKSALTPLSTAKIVYLHSSGLLRLRRFQNISSREK